MNDHPKQKHRWWRLRLSTLLIAIALAALWMALTFQRERLSVENISQLQSRQRIDMDDAWKVHWRDDGKQLALIGWEKPVQILDSVTFWKVRTIGEGKKIVHFAFSPDHQTIAYCENSGLPTILNLQSGKTKVLDTKPGQSKLAFSPDGKWLVTGNYYTNGLLWDVRTGKQLHELDVGPMRGGLHPRFSPDGKYVAIGNRNAGTCIFLAETGERVCILKKPMTQELAFHPTEPVIAVAYVNASIALWDYRDGSLLHQVQTTADEIYTLDWSPDGSMLASAGLQGDINIWRGDDLTLLHTIAAPEWTISIRFRPDMRGIVIAGGERIAGGKRYVEELIVPTTAQRLLQ